MNVRYYTFKFNNRKEAKAFIARMSEVLDIYGTISCTDARELAGMRARSSNEDNIGWVNIDGVTISHIPHQYVVTMPMAIYFGPSEKKKHLTPTRIFEILSESDHLKTYTFIIMGRVGPTGKTWLFSALKNINAFEISEHVAYFVDYTDDSNHVNVDDENKTVTIVLNHRYDII